MYGFKTIFKRKYRITCFFLCCFLSFGIVSSHYLTVQAFDWAAPSVYLPFDGAIPYLMGMLGVAPQDKSLFNEESYKEYLLENGYTEEDLNNNSRYAQWVQDISEGKLNQASEFWVKFKSWVKNKLGATTVNINSLSSICSNVGISISGDYTIYPLSCVYVDKSANQYILHVVSLPSLNADGSCSITYNSNIVNFKNTGDISLDYYKITSSGIVNVDSISVRTTKGILLSDTTFGLIYGLDDISNFPSYFKIWDLSDVSSYIYNLDLIDKFQFALFDAVSSSIPDVIPLPWDQIGDTVDEITDTIDGLIEQVNSGVISISAYMQAILDMVGAIAVDTTTDLVYPQNPDKPDETLDDKVDENKDNMGFTLMGLEKVFPFCIPFDIYAFMTLLVAEPVAPVINWPVYNPITQQNEIITIDFSTWESVVVLFRYIFDFLFIIGMLLMARALIGGGDSA